jgi:hypothetical protein
MNLRLSVAIQQQWDELKRTLRGVGFDLSGPSAIARCKKKAALAPTNCAMMKAMTPLGAIPANVSEKPRAIVTAGLANEVDAVNQYAAMI